MSSDFESARNRSHGEFDIPGFVAALKASGALQFGTFTLASVTTGGTLRGAIDRLREHGAVVEDCVCVVDREEGGAILLAEIGVRLHALLRASELIGS